MEKNKREPKIRFRGYSEEWIEKRFGDTFDMMSNNTLSRDNLNYEFGEALNVHYGDILIKFGECTDAQNDGLPYITDSELVTKFQGSYLTDGDIVFADTAEDEAVGKCTEIVNVGDKKVIAGLHSIPCRSKEKFAPKFMGYYLNSGSYQNQLKALMQGVKVLSISRTGIQDTGIVFSSDEKEQKKIGEFLSTLDMQIKLEEQKQGKYKITRSAMVVKMFPQNGSKTPCIRFKEFSGDWELHTLGEVADIIGGGTPSTGIAAYWDGDISWYAPAEIGDQIYVSSSQRKITNEGLNNSSAKMLPAGTVLFTSRAGIGKTAILAEEACTNQGFQSVVPHPGELDSYFIFVRSGEMKRYAETVGAGSTFVEVSGKQMSNMEMLFPKTIDEQKAIGNYFKNIDSLINFHQQKIERLRRIKKACIEKMFV